MCFANVRLQWKMQIIIIQCCRIWYNFCDIYRFFFLQIKSKQKHFKNERRNDKWWSNLFIKTNQYNNIPSRSGTYTIHQYEVFNMKLKNWMAYERRKKIHLPFLAELIITTTLYMHHFGFKSHLAFLIFHSHFPAISGSCDTPLTILHYYFICLYVIYCYYFWCIIIWFV